MMELNVAGIVGESIVDGPGIRLTVFCQGCPHHCPGCQNPETWEFAERTRMSPEQILEMVKRNPLIRGVTGCFPVILVSAAFPFPTGTR